MRGFRFRVALLTLGVVLGYGSALFHGTRGFHGHRYCHGWHGRDFDGYDDYDRHGPERPRPSESKPDKSGT